MKKLILVAAVSLFSVGAMADDDGGAYMGLGASISHYDANHFELDSWGYHVFGGYKFNPYVAVELDITQVRLDDSDNGIDFYGDGSGIGISILPMYPLTDNLDGYLSLGYSYGTVVVAASDGNVAIGGVDSDSGWAAGAGLMWHVTDDVFLRAGVGSPTEDFGDSITTAIDIGFKF